MQDNYVDLTQSDDGRVNLKSAYHPDEFYAPAQIVADLGEYDLCTALGAIVKEYTPEPKIEFDDAHFLENAKNFLDGDIEFKRTLIKQAIEKGQKPYRYTLFAEVREDHLPRVSPGCLWHK